MAGVLQIVWFKRDLRVEDHLPLVCALRKGPTIALYCFEPSLLQHPSYSKRHYDFATQTLAGLKTALAAINVPLLICHSDMVPVLELIKRLMPDGFVIHSHEETGNDLSYRRDRQVKTWCKVHRVDWFETPHHGVVRRLKSRDSWSRLWTERMSHAPVAAPGRQAHEVVEAYLSILQSPKVSDAIQTLDQQGRAQLADLLNQPSEPSIEQRGGRSLALECLNEFFASRTAGYRVGMSSPLIAPDVCSRLSPHIALGSVSVRELVHRLIEERRRIHQLPAHHPQRQSLSGLKSFESRLHWRCHFVQKLEDQPSIEFKNIHPAYDQLRTQALDPHIFSAWKSGHTGFPLIDACMRYLIAKGWLNFRMRAMLVSFSSYQLWQHWYQPGLHLASLWLDYEPGIHYSQLQMQSGTTGINTIRMYNPTKQAQDQDPDGVFIKRWVPELGRVPLPYLFEPWTMPRLVQAQAGCLIGRDYPEPIVDLALSAKRAREQVWAIRQNAGFQAEAKKIYTKLGSRNPHRESRARLARAQVKSEQGRVGQVRVEEQQPDLFANEHPLDSSVEHR